MASHKLRMWMPLCIFSSLPFYTPSSLFHCHALQTHFALEVLSLTPLKWLINAEPTRLCNQVLNCSLINLLQLKDTAGQLPGMVNAGWLWLMSQRSNKKLPAFTASISSTSSKNVLLCLWPCSALEGLTTDMSGFMAFRATITKILGSVKIFPTAYHQLPPLLTPLHLTQVASSDSCISRLSDNDVHQVSAAIPTGGRDLCAHWRLGRLPTRLLTLPGLTLLPSSTPWLIMCCSPKVHEPWFYQY